MSYLAENCGHHRLGRFVGGKMGVANFFWVRGKLFFRSWACQIFLDQLIGIDENNNERGKLYFGSIGRY